MSNKLKDTSIKNHTYYFFDDFIKIKTFDPNNIKTDGKSYKNAFIYNIGYVTMKNSKYVKTNSVKHVYFFSAKWIDTLKKLMEIYI